MLAVQVGSQHMMPGTRCPVWGTPCGVAMWPCQCILPKYAKMTISYGERDDCWILGCYSYTFLIYPTWNLLGYYPDPDARLTQPSSVSACFRLYLCWSKRHIFFNSNSYVSTCVFSKKNICCSCCSFFLIKERHTYLSSLDPQGRRWSLAPWCAMLSLGAGVVPESAGV